MIKKTILGSLFMTCALTAGAQGIYQFADPGFEQNFEVSGDKGEPGRGWHSFATARTEDLEWMATIAKNQSPAPEHATEGYQSAHSVKLTSKFAGFGTIGANANGNLTTGRINMGSSTPDDAANYNFSDITGGQVLEFAGTPDAVTFYAKFKAGAKNVKKQGRGQFILHEEYPFQDPEVEEQVSYRVAKASQLIGESEDWKQYTVPFTYDQDVKPAKQYLLASFTTNPNPGESADDVLYIDDIYFVYNSELASLTYNGESKEIPNSGTTIDLSDQVYDASKLSYTLTGKGATAETTSYDEATAVLTLTVKGNDWSVNNDNQHVYTIQFAKPAPASEVVGQYNRWISVTLMNNLISESANNISLTDGGNGTVTFSLDYFTLVPGGDNMGPVAVPNAQLVYAADGSINIIAPSQLVGIPGLSASLPIALSANMTADKKLTASLDIPLPKVTVTVGDIPFTTEEEGKVLKVTGTVSALGASSVKGESTASVLDLTGATLGEGLTTENFAAGANDLFLITADQTLTGNNVVKGGTCANFVLTDGQSFNAPEGFTASHITYNREVKASANGTDEVYTFVLPFTFTADKVNGTVYELSGVNDGVLDFTSLEGSMELKANRPYLVVSKGTELLNNEGLSGEVLATDNLTNEVIGGVAMVGAYEATEVKSEGNENWYGYNANGQFVKANTGTINPFRTAIKSTGSQSSFALKLDGTVTGIVNLENPNAKVDVYTISGVCVRKNVPAASALNGLSRGVYIVGGQKVVK